MTIPAILGHGVFVLGFLLVAFARPGSQRRAAIRHRNSARDTVMPEDRLRIPLDRLPDSSSLSGVPLRMLLSEHSAPGAMLRDTLMIRPSTRDQ